MCRGSHGIHRIVEDGVMTYIDDCELAIIRRMLYYCHGCNAYHIRPEYTVGDIEKALSQEGGASE